MPRPTWKSAISFGLVTIPVNLYSAVAEPLLLNPAAVLLVQEVKGERFATLARRKASRCPGTRWSRATSTPRASTWS
jgi:hypothetical protein